MNGPAHKNASAFSMQSVSNRYKWRSGHGQWPTLTDLTGRVSIFQSELCIFRIDNDFAKVPRMMDACLLNHSFGR